MSNENKNISILKDENEYLVITLNCSGTSGFRWLPKYDSEYLKLNKKIYYPKSNSFGSSGEEVFEFKIKKKGHTKICFYYGRIWEDHFVKNITYDVFIQ